MGGGEVYRISTLPQQAVGKAFYFFFGGGGRAGGV